MSQYLTGLPAWLVQRLSALYLALFTLVAFVWWWWSPPLDYAAWRALFTEPLSGVAITMAFIALLLHCWVGIRNVILDYAGQHAGVRLLLLLLLGGWLIALAVWMVRLLLRSVLI
jgi:succinate dehydrogenase / fumarate reductase membrane anchor subunit